MQSARIKQCVAPADVAHSLIQNGNATLPLDERAGMQHVWYGIAAQARGEICSRRCRRRLLRLALINPPIALARLDAVRQLPNLLLHQINDDAAQRRRPSPSSPSPCFASLVLPCHSHLTHHPLLLLVPAVPVPVNIHLQFVIPVTPPPHTRPTRRSLPVAGIVKN